MDVGRVIALFALAFCFCPPIARGQARLEAIPLVVRDGICECDLPSGTTYHLIVGSLAETPAPHAVAIHTQRAIPLRPFPRESSQTQDTWRARAKDLADGKDPRCCPQDTPEPRLPPAGQRNFSIYRGEGLLHDPASYVSVRGTLCGWGRHVQVYVENKNDREYLQSTIDDIVRTFDTDTYPKARLDLGTAYDVDGDGRFTILLTRQRGSARRGQAGLGGWVRGSDFYSDLPAPFGNRCDMMYLSSSLRPGSHLRTLLAHEYTHAVVSSARAQGARPGLSDLAEEPWLEEGLAHLIEDRRGHGWSNLDFRIAAYLSDPEKFSLRTTEHFLGWSGDGHRGASYLFLRWCQDRHGPDLARRLVQTSLSGIANLEVATLERFPDLFRSWGVAMLAHSLGSTPGHGTAWQGPGLRESLGQSQLTGLRIRAISPEAPYEISLAGTAMAFVRVPDSGPWNVRIEGSPSAHLQVTLVRPEAPEDMARATTRSLR